MRREGRVYQRRSGGWTYQGRMRRVFKLFRSVLLVEEGGRGVPEEERWVDVPRKDVVRV